MCRETFAFSCFNHFQLALSIVGCAVPITRNLTELQLRQCVINAIRNAAYRWWIFQSGGSLCPEQCLGTFTLPYAWAHFALSLVLPATEPTDSGHRQACAYQLDALGWWSCWMMTLNKDNVKKQGMRKQRTFVDMEVLSVLLSPFACFWMPQDIDGSHTSWGLTWGRPHHYGWFPVGSRRCECLIWCSHKHFWDVHRFISSSALWALSLSGLVLTVSHLTVLKKQSPTNPNTLTLKYEYYKPQYMLVGLLCTHKCM
jgi:hypothetical protein